MDGRIRVLGGSIRELLVAFLSRDNLSTKSETFGQLTRTLDLSIQSEMVNEQG